MKSLFKYPLLLALTTLSMPLLADQSFVVSDLSNQVHEDAKRLTDNLEKFRQMNSWQSLLQQRKLERQIKLAKSGSNQQTSLILKLANIQASELAEKVRALTKISDQLFSLQFSLDSLVEQLKASNSYNQATGYSQLSLVEKRDFATQILGNAKLIDLISREKYGHSAKFQSTYQVFKRTNEVLKAYRTTGSFNDAEFFKGFQDNIEAQSALLHILKLDYENQTNGLKLVSIQAKNRVLTHDMQNLYITSQTSDKFDTARRDRIDRLVSISGFVTSASDDGSTDVEEEKSSESASSLESLDDLKALIK